MENDFFFIPTIISSLGGHPITCMSILLTSKKKQTLKNGIEEYVMFFCDLQIRGFMSIGFELVVTMYDTS